MSIINSSVGCNYLLALMIRLRLQYYSYSDQFAMLSEKVSRKKDELKIREKEHKQVNINMNK